MLLDRLEAMMQEVKGVRESSEKHLGRGSLIKPQSLSLKTFSELLTGYHGF